MDLYITPDAKILIETVGEVDVRGLTLAEAEAKVKRAVSSVYRVESSVSLRRMREFKVNVIGAIRFPGSLVATPCGKRRLTDRQRRGGTEQRDDGTPFHRRTSVVASSPTVGR